MSKRKIVLYFVLSLIMSLTFAMPMSAEQLAVANDIAISCEVEDKLTVGITPRGVPCSCGGIMMQNQQTTAWGFTGSVRIVPGSNPPIMEREQSRGVTTWLRCSSCGLVTLPTTRHEFRWVR